MDRRTYSKIPSDFTVELSTILEEYTQQYLSHRKVCKSKEETQLQRKGVLAKGFGYLLEEYLGLVVCYPILVRVF
jgi:hypothetical protein